MLSGRIEGNLHSSSFEFYFGLNWLVTFRTEGTIMQLSGYFMQVVAMQITFGEQRQHSKSPPGLAGGNVEIVILSQLAQPKKM